MTLADAARTMRIAIIGTGFSGLCAAIQLKQAGNTHFTLFEKADSLGGTWRENTYPGCECDVPSALYSFSFERNPRWTHKWSEQPEILRYMDHCADKYGIRPHIRFNAEVVSVRFDEAAGVWHLETADGTLERFDAVICAVGQLHKAVIPDFEGRDSFAGPAFHSAQWDHSVDLAGKRVSVVGNAASAIQFIPQIAPVAGALTVFQRSANWIAKKDDREYSEFEKRLGSVFPPLTRLYRFMIWMRGEGLLYPLMETEGWDWLRKQTEEKCIAYIEEKIADPDLRKKLIPDYPIGAKRILFSDDYYDALARPNVDVVTDPIARLLPSGIETRDGTQYPADVIVYSTGFDTNTFMAPMAVTGRAGLDLNALWAAHGAEAYLGVTHTGFPNFFMMYGPNTNLGHNSIIIMIEGQTRYILSCLDAVARRGKRWLEVKSSVQDAYNQELQDRMAGKVWGQIRDSWYLTNGKVTNNWVGRTTEYVKRTRKVDPDDYVFA